MNPEIEITLYCTPERNQHTVLAGRTPEVAYAALMTCLRNGLADFRSITLMVLASKSVSKSEQTRHGLIVDELEAMIKELENMPEYAQEYRARMCALVLVRMTEISLATLEGFAMLKRPPKGIQRVAGWMTAELVKACKQQHVQPYDNRYLATRVQQRLAEED